MQLGASSFMAVDQQLNQVLETVEQLDISWHRISLNSAVTSISPRSRFSVPMQPEICQTFSFGSQRGLAQSRNRDQSNQENNRRAVTWGKWHLF
jgi:hypothetical protein